MYRRIRRVPIAATVLLLFAGIAHAQIEDSVERQKEAESAKEAECSLGCTAVNNAQGIAGQLAGALEEGTGAIGTPQRLFHYTSEQGLAAIVKSGVLKPSLRALNPNDVRYGNGQYLSDIVPGCKTSAQLSREFLNTPFHGARFTHFIEIDVSGLKVIPGRPHVFVIPNDKPLNLKGRITCSGAIPKR